MELINNLVYGFSVTLQPENLLYCFTGVFIGTLIGVLPGIGPAGAMSMLLPVTFRLDPVGAIIMFAGIYYGSMYGGSTTSILLNIPGEACTVVTCLDGYKMAQQGRAGPALGIAAFGSFIAGTISIVALMLIAPPLSTLAIRFGPPEYFTLMCLGLTLVTYLASGSMIKALMMATFGIFLGCIRQDPSTGAGRFTFGFVELLDGIGLAPMVMGLFGISEVLSNIEKVVIQSKVHETKLKNLLPSVKDWADSIMPILRGSLLGFFLGVLPGAGAILSSFASYAIEKKVSKHPEKFGTGAIEGVAGPESANNAAAGGAFIPLLTLGIPCHAVMALLLGALMIHGVIPGPLTITQHPKLFWGVVCSMYIGNAMLLILNLPLIGMWVQVLRIPYKILFPLILLFCVIGAYSINNSLFDVYVMLIFGVLGYLMRKFGYEGAPFVLAFVLGPMLEFSLRQSLLISDGSFLIFFTRPISLTCMSLMTVVLVLSVTPGITGKLRKAIPREEGD
ncbi:MAG: tripartite tricarboxylate transporter permease [Candidatus Hodarchaeota archaeon]